MGPLRPFVSGSVGAGRIRHVVTLSSLKDCGTSRDEVCVDTVGAGPFLAGVGGGVTYPLTERLVLVGELNTQIGAPTFTFNVDIDAGVAFRLAGCPAASARGAGARRLRRRTGNARAPSVRRPLPST